MKKILVVEDNQIVASVYRTKLQAEGFEVEVAADGQAGLEMINRIKPDLVLLDLMLPKISGVEILQKLRAQTEFQSLPIIAFSSSYLSTEAWQAGATQVLTKSSHTPKQIVEEVRKALAAAASLSAVNASSQLSPPNSFLASSADSDAAFQAGLQKSFLEAAPETVAALRASLQAVIKNGSDAANLFDLYRKIHAITGNAGLAGLLRISRITSALEALLKEVTEKPKQITSSAQHTIVEAVKFIIALSECSAECIEEAASAASILVVDDEEIARRTVAYALERADLRALRVAESTTALNVLTENRFDLVFLDIEMPEINGLELCAKLRALPIQEKTSVVFMTTAVEFERYLQSSMKIGNDLIAKPFLYSELAVKALTLILKDQAK